MVYRPTARVLAVLELLQTHGQMNARELAARLEVDERTIRRYIHTLQDMGVPVEPEIGRHGGYALRPGYKLPPMMFNDDEMLVLTLGVMLARKAGVVGAGAAVESTLAKIERVLPMELRERLRALQDTMLLPGDEREIAVDGGIITSLSIAVQKHQRTRLIYTAAEGETERDFDPYAVIAYQERWYTVGYCHLRAGLRVFRLDRVARAALLEAHFTPPADFDALDYMLNSFEAIPDRWNIEVLLGMSLEETRRRIPRTMATLIHEGEHVRLRASMPDLHEIARMLVALGCSLTIIQPPELAAAFMDIAEEIASVAQAVPKGQGVIREG